MDPIDLHNVTDIELDNSGEMHIGGKVSKDFQPSENAALQALIADYRLLPSTLYSKLAPWWIPAPWLQHLSVIIAKAVIQGATTGKSQGILVSAPPRHGKSKFLTTAVPIWVLELFSSFKIAIATYGDDLSRDFTGEIRDTIRDNPDILSVRLNKDSTRISDWRTTSGGGVFGTGIGGALTGKGYQVILVDDYIKNYKEADSAAHLESIWQWYLSVVRTRLEPGGVIVIVATRWVKNDLHGRILAQQAKKSNKFYTSFSFPALSYGKDSERGDVLGRSEGEPLFPQRYNKETLEDLKSELGTRLFNALYQQNPDDDDSKVTDSKWFRGISRAHFLELMDKRSKHIKIARGFDFASMSNKGDYSVSLKGWYDSETKKLYISLPKRGQWNEKKVIDQYELLHEQEPLNVDFYIEQEPGSSGKIAIEMLAQKSPGRRVKPSAATTSKLLRASFVIAAAERGDIFVICDSELEASDPSNVDVCPQWHDFMQEWDFFPEGEHDDQVDTLAIVYNNLTGKKPGQLTFGRGDDKAPEGEQDKPKAGQLRGLTFGRNVNYTEMTQLQQMGLI